MNILIVDDHPVFLAGIEFLLKNHEPHWRVQSVGNAYAALEKLEQTRFDLMVLDLRLPEMSGAQLLTAMSERSLDIPTLTMSAETDGQAIDDCLAAGARGFISKATQPAEVMTAIRKVRQGVTVLPEDAQIAMERARAEHSDNDETRRQLASERYGVTPRQWAVLNLMALGLSNKQIARQLSLTEYTIKTHIRALFIALDEKNRTACVRHAQEIGIVSPSSAKAVSL